VPVKDALWLARLTAELEGWFVWTAATGYRWRAVPAPAGTILLEALLLPGQIGTTTPARLRSLARYGYGWYDQCSTCGRPARECRHGVAGSGPARP
jgi:hypothetical protein